MAHHFLWKFPRPNENCTDRLRREMQGWGLGPWHGSFGLLRIGYQAIQEALVTGKAEEQYIEAFESDHSFGNRDILIEKVWGKEALWTSGTADFSKKMAHEYIQKSGDKSKEIPNFTWSTDTSPSSFEVDPGLPVDLMGESWIGFEAMNIFKEIRGTTPRLKLKVKSSKL